VRNRNIGIFPNLVINDIMSLTIRTFYPIAPDYMEVNAWAMGPIEESAEDSAVLLDNFLTFLGPGGGSSELAIPMALKSMRSSRPWLVGVAMRNTQRIKRLSHAVNAITRRIYRRALDRESACQVGVFTRYLGIAGTPIASQVSVSFELVICT
jgi:hypothetical protein